VRSGVKIEEREEREEERGGHEGWSVGERSARNVRKVGALALQTRPVTT